jgi:predicted metallopeptidase
MQLAIGVDPHYALEFISERFDKMNKEEQVKVIVHELMHIPATFGGGFRHHDHVTTKNVDRFYKEYKKIKENEKENSIDI